MDQNLMVVWLPQVGHTKGYVQVLVVGAENMLGTSAMVKITSVRRWSLFAEVIEILNQVDDKTASSRRISGLNKCSPCSSQNEICECSNEQNPSTCGPECCGGNMTLEEGRVSQIDKLPEDHRNSQNLIGWLLWKRKNYTNKKAQTDIALESLKKQEWTDGSMRQWDVVDGALLGVAFVSFLTVVALLINLGFRTLSSK